MPGADTGPGNGRVLLIACGALGREIIDIFRLNGWRHVDVSCLPAIWHNTPEKIPEGVRAKIRKARDAYDKIFVLYADCGTGGMLDAVLQEEGVERIEGAHCYAFFSGIAAFDVKAEENPYCFYLTDYLVRHFERLIIQGMGIDRHPQLRDMYFANYTTLVYLSQIEDPRLLAQARAAAERLGLTFEHRPTGYGELGRFIAQAATKE